MKSKRNIIFVWLIFALSYLLDGFLSLHMPYIQGVKNAFVLPSFLVVAIVLMIPFIQEKRLIYYPIITFGFLYDLVYKGEIGVYIVTYISIYFAAKFLYNYLNENIFNASCIVIVSLLVKELLVSTIYFILKLFDVSYLLVLDRFFSSILVNVIYTVVLFIIIERLSIRYRLRQ